MSWFSGNKKQKKSKTRGRRRAQLTTSYSRLNRFEHLENRHLLAVLTVNTNLDTTATDTVLTLREALAVVNSGSTAGLSAAELAQVNTTSPLGANDLIQFDSTFFATPKTIALTATGQLPIQKSVSILGTGAANLTIDATAATSRIFQIDAGDVSIKGLTLTKGAAGLGNGGAINSNTLGMLSVADSVMIGNTAINGGAIFAAGDLILTNSTIGGTAAGAANTVIGSGGGIDAQASLTLKNSSVIGNSAGLGAGGGIEAQFSTVSLQNSTIDSNTAFTTGGGIDTTTVVAQYSTISGNTTTTGNGGGIDAITTVLRNSTVSGNTATAGNGGGVFSTNITVQNSTVANNHADAAMGGGLRPTASLNMQNSIVANNTAATFPDLVVPASSNVRFSLIQNFTGNAPGGVGTQYEVLGTTQNSSGNFIGNAGTPITTTQALGTALGALASNGGPTQTIDITGSIAVNKGSNVLAVSPSQGDQRGLPFARISPLGGIVDMGAFEVQTATVGNNPPTLVVAIATPQNATVGAAFNLSVAGNFHDPDGDPLTFAAERVSGLALPDWLTFNTSTGVFSGVPTANDVGSIQIKVTATDNKTAPATSPPLPSSTFTLTVSAAPVIPPVGAELPFTETFEGPVPPGQIAPDPRLKEKSPSFATTTASPITGTASLQATRPTVGSRPVATVDFTNPGTAASVTNVSVNVSTGGGNGTTLWNNAQIVFDYQSPTNYKFAGVFQIIHRLIIGQVVNGKVTYLSQKAFNAAANTTIPLQLAINRTTRAVTLTSGATSVAYTFPALGTGTVGVGTINANSKFDDLVIS